MAWEMRGERTNNLHHLALLWVSLLKANMFGKELWENSSRESRNPQRYIHRTRAMATQTKGSWSKAAST